VRGDRRFRHPAGEAGPMIGIRSPHGMHAAAHREGGPLRRESPADRRGSQTAGTARVVTGGPSRAASAAGRKPLTVR
jgi:hypothetical protein